MTILPIEHEHSKFETELENACKDCTTIRIGTAFIDLYAIRKLEQILQQKTKFRPNIFLLIGVYLRFNKKDDLLRLRKLANQFSSRFNVHVSSDDFHWKYYAIEKKQTQFSFFIGSSNFTRNGLRSIGELMFRFDHKISKAEENSLLYTFNDAFSNSMDIADFDIENYIERKLPFEPAADKKVKQLLSAKSRNNKADVSPKRFGAAFSFPVPFTISEERIIRQSIPEWLKRNWEYYSGISKTEWQSMQKVKYLFNFYRQKGKYYVALSSYEDRGQSTNSNIRYLIAHKHIKTKVISKSRETNLISVGLNFRRNLFKQKIKILNRAQSLLLQKFFDLSPY